MNILIGGDGAVSRSVRKLNAVYGLDHMIEVAEKRAGHDVIDEIVRRGDEFDLIMNLTDQVIEPIYRACIDKVDYLDAGCECDGGEVYADAYRKMLAVQPGSARFLYGCGMNPGLVELLFWLNRPKRPYFVLEIESDTASRAVETCPPVFNTWSPTSCHRENFAEGSGYVPARHAWREESAQLDSLVLHVEDRPRAYRTVLHEETITLCESDPNCRGAVFLYSAAENFVSHCQRHRDLDANQLYGIPVPTDGLSGGDTVGVAFCEIDGGEPVYVYNRADNRLCTQRYGVNATCWQTACGLLVAAELIRRRPCGSTGTFLDLARQEPAAVRELLEHFGFVIERRPLGIPTETLRTAVIERYFHP